MSEQRDLTMGELAALVAPICEDNAYISVSRFWNGDINVSISTKFGMTLEGKGPTVRAVLGKFWQTHTEIAAVVFIDGKPPAPLKRKPRWWRFLP